MSHSKTVRADCDLGDLTKTDITDKDSTIEKPLQLVQSLDVSRQPDPH